MLKKLQGRNVMIWITIAIVFLISVYPMLAMLLKSVQSGDGWTLDYFRQVITDPRNVDALKNTLIVSTAATFLSLLLGTGLAFLVNRTDVRGRRVMKSLALVPLFVPPFVYAMGWQQMFNPAGYLNKLFMALTGRGEGLFNIYGPVGIIIVMATANMAQVYLVMEAAFLKMDTNLEEAARICGANPGKVLRSITLPVLLPNLLAAAVMVFVTSISNFGIPAVLGFQVSYNVMTTRIYRVIQSFYIQDNFNLASSMAIVLLLLSVLSLWLKDRALKKRSFSSAHVTTGAKERFSLGKLKTPLFLLTMLVLLFASVMPLVAILLTALTKAYGLPPIGDNLTLRNFASVFNLSLVSRSILNSFLLAVLASSLAVMIGLFVSYILARTNLRLKKAIDIAVATPYSIPGTIVALAIILAFGRQIFGISLYNTFWIILVAYLTRYLFFSVRTLSAAMTRVSPSLEEAARASGAGWLRSNRDVLLPLVKNEAFSAWILIFAHTISELTVSILLWSVGNETVAVAVFNLQDAGDNVAASALAVILLIITSVSYYLSEYLARRKPRIKHANHKEEMSRGIRTAQKHH